MTDSIQSRCHALALAIARKEEYIYHLPLDQFNQQVQALARRLEDTIDDFLNDAYEEIINPSFPSDEGM